MSMIRACAARRARRGRRDLGFRIADLGSTEHGAWRQDSEGVRQRLENREQTTDSSVAAAFQPRFGSLNDLKDFDDFIDFP